MKLLKNAKRRSQAGVTAMLLLLVLLLSTFTACTAESEQLTEQVKNLKPLEVVVFIILFGIIIAIQRIYYHRMLRMEQENNSRNEKIVSELMAYRQAIIAHALITFIANLTKDEIINGFWIDDSGEQTELRDILGMELPCSYDKYIRLWQEKFVGEDFSDAFAKNTDRQELLNVFNSGYNEVTFDYAAYTISGTEKYLRRIISLSQDEETGDIIAYTSVKDITLEKQISAERLTQSRIISRFSDRYNDVYLLDINRNEVTPIRVSGKAVGVDDVLAEKAPYEIAIKAYIMNNVYHDDQGPMIEATRLTKVCACLKENVDYVYHYRAHVDDEFHFYYMQAVRLGEDEDFSQIVVGFANEDEEKKKEKILEEAMIEAQNANLAKSTFLFNMSHDIRTPMNAIIGFTEIAERHIDDSERVKNCLEKVKVSSEHLLSLINDVLDMSRVESGKVVVNEEPVCIDTGLDNLLSISSANAEDKNIEISAMIDPSVKHHWIYSDRLLMIRIFANTISNSIKYTEPGGRIEFTIRELRCKEEGFAKLRYIIKDNGIGMSKEFLEKIYEPFTRAESSTRSGVVGTGLGMTITKSLVELMGGTITITSELGEGTTVTIDVKSRIAEPVEDKKEDSLKNPEELKGRSILLVEDNLLNREIAMDILQEAGMTVETAEDGDIAVEMMKKATVDKYDLILMDIQMPHMNGYEATKAIRAFEDKALANIPIVAMTANAFEEDKRNAYNAGMDGHIAKPVEINKLLKSMSEILEGKRWYRQEERGDLT